MEWDTLHPTLKANVLSPTLKPEISCCFCSSKSFPKTSFITTVHLHDLNPLITSISVSKRHLQSYLLHHSSRVLVTHLLLRFAKFFEIF